MVRTRIAPSPTGYLHVGTARTALFNFLFARSNRGAFVVRIEDTDLERSDPKYETEILESLQWLGIAADESPLKGGPSSSYRQSQRRTAYRPYVERLLASGQAFRCPHTEAELKSEQKSLRAEHQPPTHWCSYRDAGATAPPQPGIIRFAAPRGRTIAFTDLIRGEIRFASDLLGDFSIAKDLQTPLYNFAVVIDDHEMEISHVIRGEDHISNTPKPVSYTHLTLPTTPYV